MKYSIAFLCLIVSFVFWGQNEINLKDLQNSDWRVKGDWFGKNTVVLLPLSKLDTAGLILLEKTKILSRNWLERIHFDENEQLVYTYYLSCTSCEKIYDLQEFNYKHKTINVKFAIRDDMDRIIDEGECSYLISQWSKEIIVLVKLT